MKWIRDFIAYLIYDRKWTWLEIYINRLCELEMAFERGFDDSIVYADCTPDNSSYSLITKCNASCETVRKHLREMEKIPVGMYCYDNMATCPFWSYSDIATALYGEQSCGYCHLMKKGDFNSDTMILWDQCKCCGINEDDEDEE